MDDIFSHVIYLDVDKPKLSREDLHKATQARCFDGYFFWRNPDGRNPDGGFWFRPVISKCPALNEFWTEVEKLSSLRIRRSFGFVSIEYPKEYSRREVFVYDYLLHQFARIPTILVTTSEEEIPESFQDCIEKTIQDGNFYFSFNVRFDYREVLKRLTPGRLSGEILETILGGQKKQTWIVSEILRPVAVVHVPTGKFIQRNMYNEDAIELLQFYGQQLILDKVLADTPAIIEKFPLHPRLKLVPME